MVREDGVWSPGIITPDELKDDFFPVTDSKEVETFVQAAIAAESSL
jgi:hypothetical protein